MACKPCDTRTFKNTNIIIVGVDLLADGKKILPSGKNLADNNFLEMHANGEALLFGSGKTFEKIKNRLANFTKIELTHLPQDTLIGDITSVQSLLNMEGRFTYFEYVNKSLNSLDKLPLKNLMLIDDNSAGEFSLSPKALHLILEHSISPFLSECLLYIPASVWHMTRRPYRKILKTIGIERTLINLSLSDRVTFNFIIFWFDWRTWRFSTSPRTSSGYK